MTFSLLFIAFAITLLILAGFALLRAGKRPSSSPALDAENETGRAHVTFFPQIRQALAAEDYAFLSSQAPSGLSRRVRRERRAITLAYLACLRQDFLRLWRLARVVSQMAPRVGVAQEFARLRLGVGFSVRYELIRLGFLLGFEPLPVLGSLNEVVSTLAMRMELAMQELGERAALAAELTSSLDRRGLGTP
ncbi:MAG TPA: hypothetical protein VE077_20325 [Candidatus Methylomirabilis sp.]|nr:hypothetical protein [Candidatus Methylomirabilis sp.]